MITLLGSHITCVRTANESKEIFEEGYAFLKLYKSLTGMSLRLDDVFSKGNSQKFQTARLGIQEWFLKPKCHASWLANRWTIQWSAYQWNLPGLITRLVCWILICFPIPPKLRFSDLSVPIPTHVDLWFWYLGLLAYPGLCPGQTSLDKKMVDNMQKSYDIIHTNPRAPTTIQTQGVL